MKHFVSLLVLILSIGCIKPPNIWFCRALHTKKIETTDAFGIKSITIKPNPVCLKEINESECGFCTKTITNETKYIGESENYRLEGQSWTDVQNGALIVSSDSYAQLKEFIINSCKKSKECQKDISKWRTKVDF